MTAIELCEAFWGDSSGRAWEDSSAEDRQRWKQLADKLSPPKEKEEQMGSAPRPWTRLEMREKFLKQLQLIADYWITTSLAGPEFRTALERDGEVRYRMEGMLFSFLVLFDGGNIGLPALDISPSPHPSDEAYSKDCGENWWPAGVVFNDCQLHDLYSSRKKR